MHGDQHIVTKQYSYGHLFDSFANEVAECKSITKINLDINDCVEKTTGSRFDLSSI